MINEKKKFSIRKGNARVTTLTKILREQFPGTRWYKVDVDVQYNGLLWSVSDYVADKLNHGEIENEPRRKVTYEPVYGPYDGEPHHTEGCPIGSVTLAILERSLRDFGKALYDQAEEIEARIEKGIQRAKKANERTRKTGAFDDALTVRVYPHIYAAITPTQKNPLRSLVFAVDQPLNGKAWFELRVKPATSYVKGIKGVIYDARKELRANLVEAVDVWYDWREDGYDHDLRRNCKNMHSPRFSEGIKIKRFGYGVRETGSIAKYEGPSIDGYHTYRVTFEDGTERTLRENQLVAC